MKLRYKILSGFVAVIAIAVVALALVEARQSQIAPHRPRDDREAEKD